MRLKDKVAIITGVGAGIGRAAAELFAREGAKVVIAEIDETAGQAVADAIGPAAVFVKTDVSDEDSMAAMVRTAIDRFGRIDILYNNAGGSRLTDGAVTTVSNDEFWLKMKVDVFGTWLGCRLVIPHMIAGGGGSVVNSTSIHGLIGVPGRNAYAAAKGAIVSLTRALAVQYAADKVRVNAVAPGGTLTERVKARLEGTARISASPDDHLLGLAEPIDVAQAALYLASDESPRTTGHIMVVDSGLTVH